MAAFTSVLLSLSESDVPGTFDSLAGNKKASCCCTRLSDFSFPFNPSDVHLFCHFRAQRGWKGTKTLYSHSMQTNAFRLIFVSPVRSRDSDSTDYLYSPCSTASVYHFFISVIKRLFCCGLRGLFPWIHYSISSMLKQAFSIILCI